MENKKSYYAVIPATVRYDKNIISGAKLLYGEITALCNEKGFCWATNKYFADLYEVDSRTIRRWVQSLIRGKYIRVEIVNDVDRKIYVIQVGQKSPKGEDKNVLGGGQKRPHNNTSNTTENKVAEPSSASSRSRNGSGSKPKKDTSPIVWAEEIKKLEDSDRRAMNILALFMEYREKTLKKNIKNKEQLSLFIKRHLRAATSLDDAEYTDEQIIEAFDITKVKCADIDWTLDTILKHFTK